MGTLTNRCPVVHSGDVAYTLQDHEGNIVFVCDRCVKHVLHVYGPLIWDEGDGETHPVTLDNVEV